MVEEESINTYASTIKLTLADPSPEIVRFLDDWSSLTPTLYFLDQNCISPMRNWLNNHATQNQSESNLISRLKKIDKSVNGIAYFTSVTERISSMNSLPDVEAFIEQARNDFGIVSRFFKEANIREDLAFLEEYIRSVIGNRIESESDDYFKFLQEASKLGLHNTPPRNKRYQVLEQVLEIADVCKVTRSHTIVLAVLGAIFGCSAATGVLKFKEDHSKYDPSNALGDLLTFTRMGRLFYPYAGSINYKRTDFITGDRSLSQLLSLFNMQYVAVSNTPNGAQHKFNFSVNTEGLLPLLYTPKNRQELEENAIILRKICAVIGAQG